jgi:hypothetical protein
MVRPLPGAAAEISIIPHLQQFVNRQNRQIFSDYFSQICAFCHLDFWGCLWYNNNVKGASE